jgi:glycosyltransferase involved in cell wall biosynthesis
MYTNKILLVCTEPNISGSESQLLLLANCLKKKKYDITICCLGGDGEFVKAANHLKLKCKVINRITKFDILRMFKFLWFINKNRFSLIMSFNYVANNMTRISKILLPFSNFIHFAGERGRKFSNKKFINYIDAILSKFSDKIITNSNIQKEKLLYHENIPRSKVKTIYNGFDFNLLDDISKIYLYKNFSIPKQNKVICSIGNLTKPKNIPMFLNVAKKVIAKKSNVSFLYVGGSSIEKVKKYQDLVKTKSLNNKVFFVGKQNNVLQILKSCDIFILTSTQEGMPNVIIEAMASKIPIVSTNVDGISEIIRDKKNGFLVNSNDIHNMIKKINILLSNNELADEFKTAAYEKVKKDFYMGKMIDSYTDLIQKHI